MVDMTPPPTVVEFAEYNKLKDVEEAVSVRILINDNLYNAYSAINQKNEEVIILLNGNKARFADEKELKEYFSGLFCI